MSGARALGYLGSGGVPFFQVTRRKGGTISRRYRRNGYVHPQKSMPPDTKPSSERRPDQARSHRDPQWPQVPSKPANPNRRHLHRQSQLRTQPATLTIAQGQRPSNRDRQLLGDRQPQPGAAGAAVAGILNAIERLHHLLEFLLGDPRATVEDPDREVAIGPFFHLQLSSTGKLQCVVREVDQHPAQGVGGGYR